MLICAPSLRSALVSDALAFTRQQLELLTGLLAKADLGDQKARNALESELLHIQSAKHRNPFVSCSHMWSVAQSFALFGDKPGYVLTIEGDPPGFDFAAIREKHHMFGDAVDYLCEFGVPVALGPDFDFTVIKVDYVQPFGRPTEAIYP
jgi:hypothetical protein